MARRLAHDIDAIAPMSASGRFLLQKSIEASAEQ